MAGMVESFNVSVAAGILMHHAARDRLTRSVSLLPYHYGFDIPIELVIRLAYNAFALIIPLIVSSMQFCSGMIIFDLLFFLGNARRHITTRQKNIRS